MNCNHHEGVNRLATRATCAQVLMAIRQGLFRTFSNGHGPCINAFFNDCDQDVCLTWFLLKHGHLAEHLINPLLNRLVAVEDHLDSTAGAYPFPSNFPLLGKVAWVFEPYTRFRSCGGIERKNPEEFVSVVEDVEHRILRHIVGEGGTVELDTRYTVLGQNHGWTMVEETGPHARTALFADGIQAFIAVRKHVNPDSWAYVGGRMSPFIPFPTSKILFALNEAEGCQHDRWGGSDMVWGSPRVSGSKLNPQIVGDVVNGVLVKA